MKRLTARVHKKEKQVDEECSKRGEVYQYRSQLLLYQNLDLNTYALITIIRLFYPIC